MATLLQCLPLAAPIAAQQRCLHTTVPVTPCKRATIAKRSVRVSAAATLETPKVNASNLETSTASAANVHIQELSNYIAAQVSPKVAALSNLDRVSILAEALPYMQRFSGKTIVVKYGGAAMKDPTLKVPLLRNALFYTV